MWGYFLFIDPYIPAVDHQQQYYCERSQVMPKTMSDIRFPAFALFQKVPHKGGIQAQFRPNRKLPSGQTVIVIPDVATYAPIIGKTIPITPGRVVADGGQFVLVTCYIRREDSVEAEVERAFMKLRALQTRQTKKDSVEPIREKTVTGRFVTRDVAQAKVSVLEGRNVLRGVTPEMRRAALEQSRNANITAQRGTHVVGTRKQKASEPKKKRAKITK